MLDAGVLLVRCPKCGSKEVGTLTATIWKDGEGPHHCKRCNAYFDGNADYSCWLVEHRKPTDTEYFALNDLADVAWVTEADDAVHFARRDDCERVCRNMPDDWDIAICEHLWPGGMPREPIVPTFEWDGEL